MTYPNQTVDFYDYLLQMIQSFVVFVKTKSPKVKRHPLKQDHLGKGHIIPKPKITDAHKQILPIGFLIFNIAPVERIQYFIRQGLN